MINHRTDPRLQHLRQLRQLRLAERALWLAAVAVAIAAGLQFLHLFMPS
jgi:hypothetical protein